MSAPLTWLASPIPCSFIRNLKVGGTMPATQAEPITGQRNGLIVQGGVHSHGGLMTTVPTCNTSGELSSGLVTSHGPYPAFVIDRQWDVVARNQSTREWQSPARRQPARLTGYSCLCAS